MRWHAKNRRTPWYVLLATSGIGIVAASSLIKNCDGAAKGAGVAGLVACILSVLLALYILATLDDAAALDARVCRDGILIEDGTFIPRAAIESTTETSAGFVARTAERSIDIEGTAMETQRARALLVRAIAPVEADPQTLAVLAQPAGDGAYRGVQLDRAEVMRLAADCGTERRVRIDAAKYLRMSAGEEERARVRVAAEETADPEVQKALLRVAEAGEE